MVLQGYRNVHLFMAKQPHCKQFINLNEIQNRLRSYKIMPLAVEYLCTPIVRYRQF